MNRVILAFVWLVFAAVETNSIQNVPITHHNVMALQDEPTPCAVPVVCSCLAAPSTSDKNFVDWSLCHSKIVMGAGGMPIRYLGVAPSVDLVLTNLTTYMAHSVSENGRSGCMGQLNIAAPGKVNIKFSFVKAGTDIPVPIGSDYEMSVFDLDASAKTGMYELVGIHGYSSLEAVALKPKFTDSGTAWFQAQNHVAVENPTDLNNLTQAQLEASFSATYADTSEWVVRFHAELSQGRKKGGRNFFFSGASCASANRHECRCPEETSSLAALQVAPTSKEESGEYFARIDDHLKETGELETKFEGDPMLIFCNGIAYEMDPSAGVKTPETLAGEWGGPLNNVQTVATEAAAKGISLVMSSPHISTISSVLKNCTVPKNGDLTIYFNGKKEPDAAVRGMNADSASRYGLSVAWLADLKLASL